MTLDDSMEFSSGQELMDTLCILSILLHADRKSSDLMTSWGYNIIENKNPTRLRTLETAWTMYEALKAQAQVENSNKQSLQAPLKSNTQERMHLTSILVQACRDAVQLSNRNTCMLNHASVTCECFPKPFKLLQSPRPIRIFIDGVFDLVHSGHFNALRQAALMGDKLIVGIGSDEEVRLAKGALPIYTAEERALLVKACKWVTDVIVNTPYTISLDYLEKTGCDYVAHGDDLALNADGKDCYEEIRKAARIKTFRRTEGVSSTALISRLLEVAKYEKKMDKKSLEPYSASTSHPFLDSRLLSTEKSLEVDDTSTLKDSVSSLLMFCSPEINQTLVSSNRLSKFMKPTRIRRDDHTVVYVDGCFDVLHAGHVEFLEESSKKGDFLIVGVYDDATVSKLKGPLYPIRGLLERALCVVALRYVDQVILGAPFYISDFLMKELHINVVVHGKTPLLYSDFRYNHLIQKNMFQLVEHSMNLSSQTILQRVFENAMTLKESLIKRKQKEAKFYESSSHKEERPNEN